MVPGPSWRAPRIACGIAGALVLLASVWPFGLTTPTLVPAPSYELTEPAAAGLASTAERQPPAAEPPAIDPMPVPPEAATTESPPVSARERGTAPHGAAPEVTSLPVGADGERLTAVGPATPQPPAALPDVTAANDRPDPLAAAWAVGAAEAYEPLEPAAEAAPEPEPAAPPDRYVVQPGDTLSAIAAQLDLPISRLLRLNPGLDRDFIWAGQVLTLVAPPETVPVDGSAPTPRLDLPDRQAHLGGLRVRAPYRSQFDGDPYEGSNCGPAALGMVLDYYDAGVPMQQLRDTVIRITGYAGYDGGSSWESLRVAARERGFATAGPYDRAGRFRYWTLDDLLEQTEHGRPVLVLVRYRELPGHEWAIYSGDHYIVFLGVTEAGVVVYHDPAFRGTEGAYLTMDQATFDRAWSNTLVGENRTAMALVPR